MALPAGATEKVLIYSHDLYCLRFALEDNRKPTWDLQVKEALETLAGLVLRDWRFSYIDYVLYGILPDDPKEAALSLEGKPLNSTTTRSQEHCIADRMMESSSAAYHIKRHRKHSKRLMTVYAELTNLVQSLEIDSEYWNIISQRWSLTPSLMLSDATPVRSMATSFIRHQDIFVLWLLPGHLRCREWTWLVLSGHLHPKGNDLS